MTTVKYETFDELKNQPILCDTFFRCFHLNVQSAVNKSATLEQLFSELDMIDVFMLTESWYTCSEQVIQLPNYNSHFLNRTVGAGGGVCVLVKKSIACDPLVEFCGLTPDYEFFCTLSGCTVIAVCYRPPAGRITDFLSFLDKFLNYVNLKKYYVVLGGDFNINLLSDSNVTRDFLAVISANGCANSITKPTRITPTTESLIDLFITNFDENRYLSSVVGCGISDHFPILFAVKTQVSKTLPRRRLVQRVTGNGLVAFREAVVGVNWTHVVAMTDANVAYNTFFEKFVEIYNIYFPTRACYPSKKAKKEWITSSLLKKIRKKNQMYKKFVEQRNPELFSQFKLYRNKLNRELKQARDAYYYAMFESCDDDVKKIWRQINTVVLHSNNVIAPVEITVDGADVVGKQMCDAFNDYFVNRKTGSAAMPVDNSYCYNSNCMFMNPVTCSEVYSVFMNMKNSQSRDADDVQIKPVKYVLDILTPILTDIFNLCLNSGVFPTEMQKAKVSALYKKGDRRCVSNYRPVSILPVFSKGLEKIIQTRMSSFCKTYKLVSDNQFGFVTHKSTELALLQQKEYVLRSFEEKKVVLGVFIDFSQAFDCINHDILLSKLDRYGFRGCVHSLLASYLANRTQYVCIDTHKSSVKRIIAGVPQGSILGPMLFNLYINDILNLCQQAKCILYADDMTILFSLDSSEQIGRETYAVLQSIQCWSITNRLKINADKSKAILFRPRNKQIIVPQYVKFGSDSIEIVECLKVLGVHFNSHLTWDDHVNSVVIKLSRIAGILSKHRHSIPIKVKLLLYNSLFVSYLNYAHLVWGTTTIANKNRLHLLQKKSLRSIWNLSFSAHTGHLFQKYGISKIFDLYGVRLALSFKRELANNCKNLSELAGLCPNSAVYTCRNTERWHVPTFRTSYGLQTLSNTLPRLLNKLEARNIDIVRTSKKEMCKLIASL